MTRVSLAALATLALLGAAACQDATTSPSQNGAELRYGLSNPPPPPIDTGAGGSFFAANLRAEPSGGLLQPRYSIQQSFAQRLAPARPRFRVGGVPASGPAFSLQTSTFFRIPVTYLFNPTLLNGYVHFTSDDENGVNSSSNGMVKVKKGIVSGKGKLTIELADGVLVIDLGSVQQPPSFIGCITEIGPDQLSGPGGVCFELFFADATFTPTGGDPIEGSVDMSPACPPDNPDEACAPPAIN